MRQSPRYGAHARSRRVYALAARLLTTRCECAKDAGGCCIAGPVVKHCEFNISSCTKADFIRKIGIGKREAIERTAGVGASYRRSHLLPPLSRTTHYLVMTFMTSPLCSRTSCILTTLLSARLRPSLLFNPSPYNVYQARLGSYISCIAFASDPRMICAIHSP